jgi:GABA permease
MKNPVRSEQDAFRFLLYALVYFALIVIGYFIDHWLGLAVFVVLSLIVLWRLTVRNETPGAPTRQTPAPSPPDEHRILVIANETVGGPELLGEVRERAGGRRVRVLVVSPALNTPLGHWTNDEEEARAAAQARLDQSIAGFRAAGLETEGEIGDDDPIQAIEDAVRTFQPDELVISTHPEGRSHWLERGVVEKAQERFALPVTHVIVDLDADLR